MKTKYIKLNSTLRSVETFEGELLEHKVARITQNKEPITDGAPLVFTERKDGVKPDYNIRTDRWDYAIDAMDKVNKSKAAKRDNAVNDIIDKIEIPNIEGSPSEN